MMRTLTGVLLSLSLVLGATVFAAETETKKAAKNDETPAAEVKAEKAAEVKADKAVDPEAMVVKINDTVIKEKDVAVEVNKRLAAQAKRMPPGMEINDMMRNQVRQMVVDMKVQQALVEQKLAAKKIKVTDEEVTKEIEKIAEQQKIKMEDIPAEIEKFGMTMDDLKQQMRMKAEVDKLIAAEMKDGQVKDEEVQAFYDDNPQYFEQAERVQASHILVKVDENATDEQKAAAKAKIEDLLKKVKAGEDFAELAKANSDCPSAKDGGDLGPFSRGQMVPAFESAAYSMKDGEISDVVETQFGYHIIKKVKHLEAGKTPFDEVKDKITQHLTQQKQSQFWETYSKQMKDEAKIEYSEAEKKLREESARPQMPMMPPQ